MTPSAPPHRAARVEAVAHWLADALAIDPERIRPETRLEADLGVTGDDGVELLAAFEARFGAAPPPEAGPYFHPEGLQIATMLRLSLIAAALALALIGANPFGLGETPGWPVALLSVLGALAAEALLARLRPDRSGVRDLTVADLARAAETGAGPS